MTTDALDSAMRKLETVKEHDWRVCDAGIRMPAIKAAGGHPEMRLCPIGAMVLRMSPEKVEEACRETGDLVFLDAMTRRLNAVEGHLRAASGAEPGDGTEAEAIGRRTARYAAAAVTQRDACSTAVSKLTGIDRNTLLKLSDACDLVEREEPTTVRLVAAISGPESTIAEEYAALAIES